MAQRPPFLRAEIWDRMYPEERSALSLLVRDERVASDRVHELLTEVERHRKLARQLAERSASLLAELKRLKNGSDAAVQTKMDDLAATVKNVDRVHGPDDSEEGELVYTAPPGTELPDVSSEPDHYVGDLTPID